MPLRSTLTEGSEGSVGGNEAMYGGADLGVMGRGIGDGLLLLKASEAGECKDEGPSTGSRMSERLL